MTMLHPEKLQLLLETTKSLKVKRMFLYMAEKAGHNWQNALDMSKIKRHCPKFCVNRNRIQL